LAYIPNIGSLVANTTSKLLAAEDVPLFLPSSLSPNLQNTPGFLKALEHEIQLRIAQADDALADIRHHLRIISGLWQFKKVNISGTRNRPNTRMRALFNRFNHRMQQSVLRYRAARSALVSANLKEQHWEDRLQNLKDSDVCGPGKDDFFLGEARPAPGTHAYVVRALDDLIADVREPAEWEIVRIPGATLIPKDEILRGDALALLPQDRQIVMYCKTGVRSAETLAAVKAAGFADAIHVQGGVTAWVNQIDPSLPSY